MTNALPTPANDNLHLCPDWMTPAEVLQHIRRMKDDMVRELAANFQLRHCPKHRQDWEILIAMEKCTLWHFYGVQQG